MTIKSELKKKRNNEFNRIIHGDSVPMKKLLIEIISQMASTALGIR